MRRIERLINLIAALLDAPRPMTAEEIRVKIAGYDQPTSEGYRRQFERDKEALRAMGIPLEVGPTDAFSDQADGYTISKARYYLPQLDLEPDEVTALGLAAHAVLGGGEDAESGLLKVAIDSPEAAWTGPRFVWGADVAAEQPILAPLYSALLDRRMVSFDYLAGGADAASTRTVEPYGLVHRRGHWYLVARDPDRDDVRSFKLTRVASDVSTLDESYEIPEGFDAAARLGGEAWEIGGEPVTAVVRFDESIRWWAEQNMPEAPSRESPQGALEVEMPVANVDALVSWAIGFGDAIEIVSPDEARASLVAHLAPYLDEVRR